MVEETKSHREVTVVITTHNSRARGFSAVGKTKGSAQPVQVQLMDSNSKLLLRLKQVTIMLSLMGLTLHIFIIMAQGSKVRVFQIHAKYVEGGITLQ